MSNNNGFSFEDQQPEETETIGFNIRLEFRGDVYWVTAYEPTKHKTDAALIETKQEATKLVKGLRKSFPQVQLTVVPVTEADRITAWLTRVTA
jgi:hypothetical protein